MAKKSNIPDDILYRNFTIPCPFVAKGRHIRAINASVRCRDDKTGWPAHCEHCGWNDSVKERRLTAMVGKSMALKLIAQSDELAIKTKKEINEGKYAYV